MGTVFRGFDKKLHRQVAIKVMNAVILKEEDVKRFEREAQSMAHMQHPHICPIHDYDRIKGHPYFVMDLIDGRSLQDILEKSWPPHNRDIAKWIWQVARALRHAHAKSVRHRDIKPANIMINAEGDAILMDFGLAQYVEATQSLTQSGGFMGTPAYASPEQAKDTKTVDHRADIYSLGAVLYQFLCG
jgi:serine/threonine protein kinase